MATRRRKDRSTWGDSITFKPEPCHRYVAETGEWKTQNRFIRDGYCVGCGVRLLAGGGVEETSRKAAALDALEDAGSSIMALMGRSDDEVGGWVFGDSEKAGLRGRTLLELAENLKGGG